MGEAPRPTRAACPPEAESRPGGIVRGMLDTVARELGAEQSALGAGEPTPGDRALPATARTCPVRAGWPPLARNLDHPKED
jgi:hypothetical protein